jgi:hypothetical protein
MEARSILALSILLILFVVLFGFQATQSADGYGDVAAIKSSLLVFGSKIILVVILASFVPSTAFSFFRFTLQKKETEYQQIINLFNVTQEEVGFAQLTVIDKHQPRNYWLIPARVATGSIEWPVMLDNEGKPKLNVGNEVVSIPKPPLGIRHHYAPLAILAADGLVNCRCQITALNSCNMPSFGEEGIGGRPLCDATDT